jgi:multiple sugar transport system substrate-binding protein
MADAKGITIPDKIDDLDAFLEQAAEINADGTTAVYGTVIPGWDQWYFETLFLNSGVKIITEDNTTDLNSPAAKALVQKFQDWQNKGLSYIAFGSNASSNMRQAFYEKRAFSVMHTSSLYNNYVDNCDFEVGMAWYPGADTNISEVGGSVLFIPSKVSQAEKNAAWQFLQFLCSKDINMTWAKETGYMPTRNSVLHTEEGEQFLAEKPAFKCIFDNLDLINPRIQSPAWNQLITIWKNYICQTVSENMDVSKQMDQMAEEINEVLEDF